MREEFPATPAGHASVPTNDPRTSRVRDLLALAIVAAGFVVRILAARQRSLNGDEAVHFLEANLPRVGDVYRAGLANAHPPLFFLLLHFWIHLGVSELFLRLLPVALGTAFLWAAYRWVLVLAGGSAALAAVALLSFSPGLVGLSAEVRDYSLMLLLMTSALAAFEQALEKRSARAMVASSVFLSLALLTHYSAFFAAAALLLYGLLRLKSGRFPPVVLRTWAACQAGIGALCLFLAGSHVADLRGSSMERLVMTRMLRAEYFQADQDRPFDFLLRQTAALFRYLCGSAAGGIVALLLASAGIVILARRRSAAAVLLALPFLFGSGAALLDVYPYGGTRHSVFLLVFASAAIGVALSALAGGRLWPAALLVAALAPVCLSTIRGLPASQSARRMKAAVDEFRASAPAGSLVFMDLETGRILEYYLAGKAGVIPRNGSGGFWESSAGGYRIVGSPMWNATEYLLGNELRRFVEEYRVPAGQAIWLIHLGRSFNLSSTVTGQFPGAAFPVVSRRDEISFIEAVLP